MILHRGDMLPPMLAALVLAVLLFVFFCWALSPIGIAGG